ncbi:MAG TPA: hypothetical protein VK348_08055 [Planctomycetota bacterium]|nr:hypothetical protein [Planctomycetota bacterium]
MRGRGPVLVSSEPLSEDPGWEVPRNSLVLVRADGTAGVVPMNL